MTGDLAITSDPTGASITVDGESFPNTTPDTLVGVPTGTREVELKLDAGSSQIFRWSAEVVVPDEGLGTVDAALQGGCGRDCPFVLERGRVICRFNNFGDTCASTFFGGGIPALQWPGVVGGDYGAGGRLLIAAILGSDAGNQAGDTSATQAFRQAWIGRQAVETDVAGLVETVKLDYWGTALFLGNSLLGLSVEQTIFAVDSAGAEDILFIHYKVTNVTGDPRYQALYPGITGAGYTLEAVFLGFGLDADIGTPSDDLGTFDPDLGVGFIYDADFRDSELGSDADQPALVGVLTVEPPSGATERTRTLWRAVDDWDDGTRHDRAWRILAGQLGAGDAISDHPHPDYGFFSDEPNDYRVTEAHGPLTLAPGESAELTVALIFARPVPGTFSPGVQVVPGDPTSSGRNILAIAADLLSLAADAPALWARYRP